MGALKLDNVVKTYANGHQAMKGISLDINEGEFLVLVGPSGCGKSTTLRSIAGLESITSGEIHIADERVDELPPAKRDIAMVFQNYALYPHMTVYNNMAYGLKNRGYSAADIAEKVNAAAKMLELTDYLQRKPGQLSGGQRQRVAMGRAMVRQPKLFLFDEPLSNLDASLRLQMRLEIKRLQRSLGTTSVFVTHDQVEAMTLADRLVIMNKGEIEQVGTPKEVYHKPQTTFVAKFLGSPAMNLLPATLVGKNQLKLDDGQLIAIPDQEDAVQDGQRLYLGLRPENVSLTNEGNGLINFVAKVSEELGATQLLHGEVANTPFSLNLSQFDQHETEHFSLTFDPQQIHLFDYETGERVNA
ncbi:sn-glycerol-3-phosphate ABC transporter ATP-binding protein UgpC [Marinomonas agarivorans]|nr:sn-glycerol-3-phosphate ABC transporter ATP-binding protein UgpC [Marinomonas agarivorans]